MPAARNGSSRRQAVRGLPVGPQTRAHPQEARKGSQGAQFAPGRFCRRARLLNAPRVKPSGEPMTILRIAFAGTPQFALPALRALLKSRHRVVGVLTQPDRPAGRGQQLRASPVKLLAQDAHLPLAQPSTLKTPGSRVELTQWAPDVLVVVAYGLILPPTVLELPRLGCVNIHGSLLPRWRGAAPIQRAILAGDAETGATILHLDARLATAPLMLSTRRSIGSQETAH